VGRKRDELRALDGGYDRPRFLYGRFQGNFLLMNGYDLYESAVVRRKLQADRDRIQRDIATYAGLTKQVMQITEIITDSVKRLPGGSGIGQ
jgi:hypothetical protein